MGSELREKKAIQLTSVLGKKEIHTTASIPIFSSLSIFL
jgi:hypothetical protein